MAKLSTIVITFNEEANIERCLRSVLWSDEVIVVDSFSSDRTVELARELGATVIRHAYDGEVPQRARGFERASGDWLFWLDADEEVSPELRAGIERVLSAPDAGDGYYIGRKVEVLGKWIEHGGWFPDWQFRLVRKGKEVAEYQEIHGNFTTRGSTGRLGGHLYHYTYGSIAEYLRKMNDQTSLHVSNKLRGAPHLTVPWYKLILNPLSYFLRMFIVKKGYKDGMHGFILAVYSALYTMLVYAKTWEYRYRQTEEKGTLPPITNAEVQAAKRRYRGLEVA